MLLLRLSLLVASALALASTASAQEREITVLDRTGSAVTLQATGGSVAIARGFGAVSAKSALSLQWTMVIDTSLGLIFDAPVGARGINDEGYYRYVADMKMNAIKAVSAFEVRILVFNVWKDFEGVLSFSQLEELKPGQKKGFERVWGYYTESKLRDHYVSLAYVSRVRFADGTTIIADTAPILRAAQAIQASVTLQDLTPKPEPLPFLGKSAS
jgi:hypothetical protein